MPLLTKIEAIERINNAVNGIKKMHAINEPIPDVDFLAKKYDLSASTIRKRVIPRLQAMGIIEIDVRPKAFYFTSTYKKDK